MLAIHKVKKALLSFKSCQTYFTYWFITNYYTSNQIKIVWNIYINPLTARVFTVFGHSLLEDRALHKEAWVVKLLGTHLSIQVHKKVKFSWRDNSPLAHKERVKGLMLNALNARTFNDYFSIRPSQIPQIGK